MVSSDRIADKTGPDGQQNEGGEGGKVCSICGKRYKTGPALEVHLKMKHSQELT
jgi:hypothetical protein